MRPRQLLYIFFTLAIISLLASCDRPGTVNPPALPTQPPPTPVPEQGDKDVKTETAIFAGGCFWGVDHWFRQVEGVVSVTSGYTGGAVPNPTYEQVCTGLTGHAEAVRVIFDPAKVSYEKLARLFFEIHDPTTLNSQGPDFGLQYRSAVFYDSPAQKAAAEKLIALLRANGCNVVTQVLPAGPFYPAEDYHQDYLTRHPGRSDCHVRVDRFNTPSAK